MKKLATVTGRKSFLLVLLISGIISALYVIYHSSFTTTNLQGAVPEVVLQGFPKDSHRNDDDNYMPHIAEKSFIGTARVELKRSMVYDGVLSQYETEEAIKRCMRVTNLEHEVPSLSQSQRNARYLFDEFRRVIPQQSLSGYSSHCWGVSFSAQWSRQEVRGHIGNILFRDTLDIDPRRRKTQLLFLRKNFPAMKYKSDVVCVPNLFLAGFPKCGSSYLYCLINKLRDMTTYNIHTQYEAIKEPHFWVTANAAQNVYVPAADHLGNYILNFLPGLNELSFQNRTRVRLVDGTPNMMFNWPRFRQSERNFTNYCLIPSVLPNLLPNSKYIVIMRNPVDMVYSAFWFSCTSIRGSLPMEVQLKGPHLFHNRVKAKITLFNNCMKDSSVPSIDYTCAMDTKQGYSSCIMKRMHLLDKCIHRITFNIFSRDLPGCGRSRIAMGVYYVHVRKWLSVVSKERFLFLTLEDLVKKMPQVMLSIIKHLGLKKPKDYSSLANRAKYSCNTNTQSHVNYKHDPRLQMRADTKTMLEIFFYPFNHQLSDLLNRTALWSD